MKKKSDRTKKLIEDTLINLMAKKDFDKISVKDLTDELDINRGTFYLHFKDKYDLLEQKENEVLKELNTILNEILNELNEDFILPSDRDVLFNIFKCMYTYIKDNSNFMKIVLGTNGDLNFQMKIKTFIENTLVQKILIDNDTEKMPIKYIAPIASSAQLGIIQKWLKSGMKETPEELALFVSNIIFALYNGALKDMIM